VQQRRPGAQLLTRSPLHSGAGIAAVRDEAYAAPRLGNAVSDPSQDLMYRFEDATVVTVDMYK
jgi:hypothetical protein